MRAFSQSLWPVIAAAVLAGQSAQAISAATPTGTTDPRADATADINTPRADAQTVTFDATEGTWMSVDVSPDGKTLVFDLLGDIYSVPVGGGTATALTSGPAFDSHPRYSPDGKAIAFTSDRGGLNNIWLMDADGTHPRPATEEKDAYVRSATWTPDGRYLIARKGEARRGGIPPVELWVYHRDGGSGTKLTSADDHQNAAGAVASRDGRWIYFAARDRKFSYIADMRDGLWQIWRYDRERGESLPITSGFGGAMRPALSPDDKTLVFVSRRDDESVLVARDLASGAERILLRNVTRDEAEGFAKMDLWPNYAFTPDGKSLIFANHGRITRLDLAGGPPTTIPFLAHVSQSLAPRVAWQEKVEDGPVQARILRWIHETPDGSGLVFEAFGRLWRQDLSAGRTQGAPRHLTPDAGAVAPREYAPASSPDGKSIAYVSWSDTSGGDLWRVASHGGTPARLTRVSGHYTNPVWSPDGTRIALIRGSGLEYRGRQPEDEAHFEIVVVDSRGGAPQRVTTVKAGNGMQFHPVVSWSTDGSRLYYAEPVDPKKPTDDPKNDLVSIRLDGTDARHILRFPAVDEILPSADGQWIVFTSRDNVYLTAFPGVATKEPPEVSLKDGVVPVYRLSEDAGTYAAWSEHGTILTWALGDTFYRLPVRQALEFAAERKRANDSKPKPTGVTDAPAKTADERRVAPAQTIKVSLTAPRATPRGSVLFQGARIISMVGDEVIERADLLVTDNRIAAVGPAGTVPAPAGALRIDASGKTIIPGLIDTHAHLHYSSYEIFPEAKWEYLANLAYGVTTVYDPSAPSLDVFSQAESVAAGQMTGPRVYSSGAVLYGGQQEDIYAEVNSLDDARHQVRRMQAYGARMIKVYQQPKRSQRLWFAEACRELHMLLTAEGAGELDTDLTMAVDGYTAWEHALPVELGADSVELLARSGTFYTPTLLVAYGGPWGELYYWQTANPHDDAKLNRFVPHDGIDRMARRHPWIALNEYSFPEVAHGAARILRAGGNVSLGAHGQLQGLGPHWELWAMAGEGAMTPHYAMTPMEALRASTLLAADKLGFRPDLGSIEAGKLADFVVLDANPLEDIHNSTKSRWVVKNGEVWDATDLHRLWPTPLTPKPMKPQPRT